MAYSNSEQIFMDGAGHLPSKEEWEEIHTLLGIMQKAGFAVDDPTNAPHVTQFAWNWAHSTKRSDVTAAVKAAALESGKAGAQAVEAVLAAVRSLQEVKPQPADLAPVLQELRALKDAAARPVAVKVDDGMVKDAVTLALREPISLVSMAVLGVVIAVSLFVGSWLGKRQLEPTVQLQQQMIQKLTASNESGRSK